MRCSCGRIRLQALQRGPRSRVRDYLRSLSTGPLGSGHSSCCPWKKLGECWTMAFLHSPLAAWGHSSTGIWEDIVGGCRRWGRSSADGRGCFARSQEVEMDDWTWGKAPHCLLFLPTTAIVSLAARFAKIDDGTRIARSGKSGSCITKDDKSPVTSLSVFQQYSCSLSLSNKPQQSQTWPRRQSSTPSSTMYSQACK